MVLLDKLSTHYSLTRPLQQRTQASMDDPPLDALGNPAKFRKRPQSFRVPIAMKADILDGLHALQFLHRRALSG